MKRDLARMLHSIERATLACCNLDRSRWQNPDPMLFQHGLYDCLDAPSSLPTGGAGLCTVIGSRAFVWRGVDVR